MKTNILKVILLAALALVAVRAEALSTVYGYGGGNACSFTRDLYPGVYGEDVRCLQQYLSSSQYGAYYSYGFPDGIFGAMTRQAVMQWQASQGIPASGYWDASSRAKYAQLMGGYYGGGVYNGDYSSDPDAARAHEEMMKALQMIGDAWEEIKDSKKNTSSAESDLENALDDLRDAAWEYYVNDDYDDAYDSAKDAFENAEDAFDAVDGSDGDRNDAKDAINDAEDMINDAEDEIDDAIDRGVSQTRIDAAEDYLDEAYDKLDEADEEYDDEDYGDAEDLANEAEDLAQDAIDEVN